MLVVGGMYAGADINAAETLAAAVIGDSLGGFTGPVGANSIAGQFCLSVLSGRRGTERSLALKVRNVPRLGAEGSLWSPWAPQLRVVF